MYNFEIKHKEFDEVLVSGRSPYLPRINEHIQIEPYERPLIVKDIIYDYRLGGNSTIYVTIVVENN